MTDDSRTTEPAEALAFDDAPTLPRIAAVAPSPTAALAGEAIGARILLAEDNAINQEVAAAMLDRFGCHVEAVENGALALEAVSRSDYDMVLMDCQMPEMDGFRSTELIRQRRVQRNGRPIPIVALTANAMEADREHCLRVGMDDFLSKPFKQEQLRAVVMKWCLQTEEHGSTPLPRSTASSGAVVSEPTVDQAPLVAARMLQKPGKPDLVERLVHLFLETTPPLLVELDAALAARDTVSLRAVAHRLKSGASTLGAREVARVAGAVEAHARAGRLDEAAPLLATLRDAYGAAARELSREHLGKAEPS